MVEVAGQYLSPETNHAGMFFQDGLTGSAWGDWANYTDSPIRAFEADGGWTEHHPTPPRKKKPSGLLLRILGVVCQILECLLYFLTGPGQIVIR